MTEHRNSMFSAPQITAGVILLSVIILGGTVFFADLYMRQKIREQIAATHAQILYALWLSQSATLNTQEDAEEISADPEDQLATMLEISNLPQMKGVLATRLFSPSGKFILPFPPTASAGTLREQDLLQLQNLKPVARFTANATLTDLFPLEDSVKQPATIPLLEVSIPLHSENRNRLLGIAQYIIDGAGISEEYKALDRNVARQAAIVFLVGGTILITGLGLAFRRLQHVNSLLSERTRSLLHANQELNLAAKTSAVGAVTAHLIHGLKNPLSGLHQFMASRGSAPTGESDTEWQIAVSTTRRMQRLIAEVVRVLREESGATCYELSLNELVDVISAHALPLAKQAGIQWNANVSAEGMFTNRNANLIILILENLIQNAIQATPQGKSVTLQISRSKDNLVCEVQDEGPGLSSRARETLFTPCQSSKEGGSGIGLAISKQLASYMGAELELASSEAGHCVFALILPANLFAGQGE